MSFSQDTKVLLIAPFYDRNIPGESWSTYKWVEGISARCQATVLTTHKSFWKSESSPTSAIETINWEDPALPSSLARLNRELKPTYFLFYHRARKWLQEQYSRGGSFDLIHQINPLALRYPTPAYGFSTPYLIGPLAGSLETPAGFRADLKEKEWFRRLRAFDRMRIKHDPWLHRTYSEASAVLGVAPYVDEYLSLAGRHRFEIESETGVESIPPPRANFSSPSQPLRLLFVGRIIRTKGILDAIRAVAKASADHPMHLDVLGEGDLLESCRAESARLGMTASITFHGRIAREKIDEFYQKADVFLFPSFREPSGNVVFEAMSHGLPVITSTVGGPGYVVTDDCGFRIPPENPEQYAEQLANALRRLSSERPLLPVMSLAAQNRIADLGLWQSKIDRVINLYDSLLAASPATAIKD